MKLLLISCLTLTLSVSYAAEEEEDKENETASKDPIDFVLVCPEHSLHKGDEVPEWVTTIEAITYYCNESQDPEVTE